MLSACVSPAPLLSLTACHPPPFPQTSLASASSGGPSVGGGGDLLHRTTARTMEVLTTTGLTTKAVLTAVSDHHWWRDSLSYLRPKPVGLRAYSRVCVCVFVIQSLLI